MTKTKIITITKPLDNVLKGKAAITHNHDDKYCLLNNVVSEIQAVVAQTDNVKIPNISALRSYCSDYLTATAIANNQQLQELLKGKSAFEVWKEQQTPKQEGEPDYTYNDYIAAIKGEKGQDGTNGTNGLSAFEVWVSQQTPKQSGSYTYEEYLEAITGPKGDKGDTGPAGEDAKDGDGKSWWEYLLQYGISGASAAGTIASVVAVQNQIAALQAQIAAIEGQVATIIGSDTAEAFTEAVQDAGDTALSLGQRASNVFQSIANVFRNLSANLQVARNGANSAVSSIRASLAGYTHLA